MDDDVYALKKRIPVNGVIEIWYDDDLNRFRERYRTAHGCPDRIAGTHQGAHQRLTDKTRSPRHQYALFSHVPVSLSATGSNFQRCQCYLPHSLGRAPARTALLLRCFGPRQHKVTKLQGFPRPANHNDLRTIIARLAANPTCCAHFLTTDKPGLNLGLICREGILALSIFYSNVTLGCKEEIIIYNENLWVHNTNAWRRNSRARPSDCSIFGAAHGTKVPADVIERVVLIKTAGTWKIGWVPVAPKGRSFASIECDAKTCLSQRFANRHDRLTYRLIYQTRRFP